MTVRKAVPNELRTPSTHECRDVIAQEQIERELCFINHYVTNEEGCDWSAVLSQDDALMVGLLTVWSGRESDMRFIHSDAKTAVVEQILARATGALDVSLS